MMARCAKRAEAQASLFVPLAEADVLHPGVKRNRATPDAIALELGDHVAGWPVPAPRSHATKRQALVDRPVASFKS